HRNVYSPSSSIPQLKYAPSVNQQPKFSQPESGLIVPVLQRGDDPIDAINHVISFLTAVLTSRYPTTNSGETNLFCYGHHKDLHSRSKWKQFGETKDCYLLQLQRGRTHV
ncbi:hypothetical protein Tco_0347851, partial [Tanacetum coccineum]